MWATQLYLPTQAAAINGIMPVFAIFVTIWALSANVRRFLSRPRRGSSSPSMSGQEETKSRFSAVSRSFHRLRHMRSFGATASRGAPKDVPAGYSSPSLAATSQAQSQSLSQISSSQRNTSNDAEGARSGASQKISCPLSMTFVLLSIGISVLWALTIIFHLSGPFVGTVRTFVFAPFLGVLGLCLEASFERLMRLVSVKHAKSTRHGRGRQFFGVTTLGNGLGQHDATDKAGGGIVHVPSSKSVSEVKTGGSSQADGDQVASIVYDD
ncbi:hypothetical protein BCR44DRAFT_1434704 [Catenaria anguillulae PL171]|uniref:Uncharacterized protein n=1 Tax=Catenaria anguillulae PL171 TaxID=765915 RepID=A0A1Y2HMR9_9FUNG|nr:hypothetical protein BCR44DRAFT_1434704 [Catenaria anguillulae PL171]